MTKHEQRKAIKSVLKGLSEDELKQESLLAAKRFTLLDEFKRAKTVMAYMAMQRECDPSVIVRAAKESGKRVAFPLCIEGNRLKILVPNDDNAFCVGAYGIIEPDITRSTVIEPNDLDIIVVPGLAFDKNCQRLGRGAGFYDRLLSESCAFKAGFAFDEQILPKVCTEEHDQRLDCVVTPTEVYR